MAGFIALNSFAKTILNCQLIKLSMEICYVKGEVIYNSGEVISANDIVRVERAGGSPMVIIGFLVLIPLIFIFVVLYVKH